VAGPVYSEFLRQQGLDAKNRRILAAPALLFALRQRGPAAQTRGAQAGPSRFVKQTRSQAVFDEGMAIEV
jgi:hypothetical protein